MGKDKLEEVPLPDVRSVSIDTSSGHLGVTLENTDFGGVLISEVHPEDLIAAAGLKVGDVVLTVAGKAVNDHQEAFAAIEAAGSPLVLEYWNEAEATVAATLKRPKTSAKFYIGLILAAFVLIGAIAGGGAYYYTQIAPAAKAAMPTAATPPVGPPSAPPNTPPPPKKMKPADIIGDMLSGTIEEYEAKLEGLSRSQIVKALKKKDPNWVPKEDQSVEDMRDHLVSQAEGMRAQQKSYMESHSPEARMKKVQRQLKMKSADELRELLSDVEIAFSEEATTKELRDLAFTEKALEKWDELPADVKLEKNRIRATENARRYDAKEAARRQEERRLRQYRLDEKSEKLGYMADNPMMEVKPKWEEDWDDEQEKEALERLSRLKMWKMMDGKMIENMMSRIRNNPKVLDAIEGEENSMAQMADLMGPNGEMPDTKLLQEMGMNFRAHNFDKNNPSVIG